MAQKDKNPYLDKIPLAMIREHGHLAACLYVQIKYAEKLRYGCRYSNARLGADHGVSNDKIKRALQQLRRAGLITCKGRGLGRKIETRAGALKLGALVLLS